MLFPSPTYTTCSHRTQALCSSAAVLLAQSTGMHAHLGVHYPADGLQHGQGIGHYLAGVVVIRQAVDDGHAGILRQLQEILMAKEARHDDVVVPAY